MQNASQMPPDMPAGLVPYWNALRGLLVKARAELPPTEREALDAFEADEGCFIFSKTEDTITVYLANPRTERMTVYATVPLAALEDYGTTMN